MASYCHRGKRSLERRRRWAESWADILGEYLSTVLLPTSIHSSKSNSIHTTASVFADNDVSGFNFRDIQLQQSSGQANQSSSSINRTWNGNVLTFSWPFARPSRPWAFHPWLKNRCPSFRIFQRRLVPQHLSCSSSVCPQSSIWDSGCFREIMMQADRPW